MRSMFASMCQREEVEVPVHHDAAHQPLFVAGQVELLQAERVVASTTTPAAYL